MTSLPWIILPYSAFLSFALGQVWRYRHDRFVSIEEWADGGRLHRFGIAAFRYGVVLTVAARIAEMLGSGHHLYSQGLVHGAIVAMQVIGLPMVVAGAVLFIVPPMIADPGHPSVSPVDRMTLPVLAATLMSWAAVEFEPNSVVGHSRTGEASVTWFRSLFTTHPQPEVMQHAPAIYQIRALIILLLIAIWPYTRLGGMFLGPLIRWWKSMATAGSLRVATVRHAAMRRPNRAQPRAHRLNPARAGVFHALGYRSG